MNGLMRRAIFADTDGVVREDVEHRHTHDRGEKIAARIWSEKIKKPAPYGLSFDSAMPGENGAHRVFADAVVEVARTVRVQRHVGGTISPTAKYGPKQSNRRGRITFTDEQPAEFWAERGHD